ncbi:MAG TPA: 16S rRNA (uracil(1498)-N(3))-methyltransferase [Alphaproteobacteria bacterium]|jgi:16S rRNA (uracil1498-N3)-methyltransferase|nr:16S rRNA (uracil(1498)-N(3))-methyltransferase [Alphaproteobacteria bacterium]
MNLFYSNFNKSNSDIILDKIDSKHLSKSLRKKVGDIIRITNGDGLEIKGNIIRLGKNIKVNVINKVKHKKRAISIHIAMSPLKNPSRFEWFVEKSTEIGISEITPLITKFSEKKKVNISRLNKIVISSMKQSNQFYLPKVNPITSFDEFLKLNKDYKLIAHLKNNNSFNNKSIGSKDKIVVMIGPEGGFSKEEILKANKEKIKEISFGKNRFRSETAGVFAVSIINNYKNL